jgi:glycosyltransferase involved in cell wall biosynthesis
MEAAWAFAMPTLTVSGTLIQDLLSYDSSSPIWTVPNGINLGDYFDERRKRDGIGMVYSGDTAKSPEDAMRVLGEIPDRIPGVRRYVFGECRRPGQLSTGEYHQLPSVEKARELYNRSKIWLLTSRAEGLPGPVLEAMACGTAVISTDNEGSLEIIRHEENGLLFPIGDTRACISAIERLWRDDELHHRLVQHGFETAKAFSWDRAVHRMQKALDDLATGRRQYAETSSEAASCG